MDPAAEGLAWRGLHGGLGLGGGAREDCPTGSRRCCPGVDGPIGGAEADVREWPGQAGSTSPAGGTPR